MNDPSPFKGEAGRGMGENWSKSSLMRIGVIRTVGSPCRCGKAVIKGLQTLGHEYLLADSEEIELRVSEKVMPLLLSQSAGGGS